MEKICCFTGHREIAERDAQNLYAQIINAAETLIAEGFSEFRCGGAMGFDRMAADAVLALRKKYPNIKLHIYVPCLDQNKYFSPEENQHYLAQIHAADKILCISKTYYKGCMLQRNRAMVDGAQACIAFVRRQNGGSAYTVRYAEEKNCRVIRL